MTRGGKEAQRHEALQEETWPTVALDVTRDDPGRPAIADYCSRYEAEPTGLWLAAVPEPASESPPSTGEWLGALQGSTREW